MPGARDDIRAFLNRRPDSVLVEVTDVKGSAPRDAGAWMLVARDMIFRTIGGGQLEYMAIDHARKVLLGGRDSPKDVPPMNVPLGPEIGQCCGGRVGLSFRRVSRGLTDELVSKVDAEIATRPHVYVFGAGHVGDALASALAHACPGHSGGYAGSGADGVRCAGRRNLSVGHARTGGAFCPAG